MSAPAIFRIGRYARAIDPRIAAVTVTLVMDTSNDDVEFWPRITSVSGADGAELDIAGNLDRLAGIAWDVVEARTAPDERGDIYRVTIQPAVCVHDVTADHEAVTR